jgi:hypothetical protein
MKIDGTEKVAKIVRERATEGGWVIISAELLRDANTDYQRVYSALGGLAGGWDVVSSQPGGASFHVGCAHAEVREEFARVGANRYEVTTTCTRCQERWTTTRRGGETARSRTVRRPFYLPKDEPEARDPKGEGEGQQGEGQGEGQGGGGGGQEGQQGEGQDEGGEDQGQGQGEGRGQGEGQGEDEGGEDQGQGQGEGRGQGEDEDGGQQGEGGSGQPPPHEDPYVWAFKQHWERSLTGPQKAGVYRRLTLFVG